VLYGTYLLAILAETVRLLPIQEAILK